MSRACCCRRCVSSSLATSSKTVRSNESLTVVSKTATTLRRKRSPNGRGLRAECVHRLLQERRRRGDRRSCRVVSLIRRVVALVVTVPTEEGSGGWWWWRAGHRLVAHARLTKNGCDALAAKCCDVFAPWPLTTGCRLTGPPDCIRHRVGRGWGGDGAKCATYGCLLSTRARGFAY